MDNMYIDYVCAKTYAGMIIATLGQHKDINFNLGGNLIRFYKNIDEPEAMKVVYFLQSYIHCAASHKSNKELYQNCVQFAPIWGYYKSINKTPLKIQEYTSFTRMNYTPSDKFLCDCCSIFDGTSIFQLNVVEYILKHSKNKHLKELDDWEYTCVEHVSDLYDIKYSPVWLFRDTVPIDIHNHYQKYIRMINVYRPSCRTGRTLCFYECNILLLKMVTKC